MVKPIQIIALVCMVCIVCMASGCHSGSVSKGAVQAIPPPIAPDDFKVQIGKPEPQSPRGQALTAIERGSNFVLYSLTPYEPPLPSKSKYEYGTEQYKAEEKRYLDVWHKEKEASCEGGKCLYLNPVLGKIEPTDPAGIETLKATLRSTLGKVPNYAAACAAEYRHAISFNSDGKQYDILLCYHCGQVGVAINGKEGFEEQAYDMGKQDDLDAMLTKAGIPLAPKPEW